ncbi:DUF1127 domain-containing protein [Amaricoccus tamworthensis]|uniref:DUF1127 domain-containing protein n=1 Tax=Amaricoccus tamworthensis TaxID=57002 RepID=UPI003C7983DB
MTFIPTAPAGRFEIPSIRAFARRFLAGASRMGPTPDQIAARHAFRRTVRLSDRMLDDIGVTRAEVTQAAMLPIHINAAQWLHDTAKKRRLAEAAMLTRGRGRRK